MPRKGKKNTKKKDAARKARESAAANPSEEAKAQAVELKAKGNAAFQAKDYDTAVRPAPPPTRRPWRLCACACSSA